VNHDQEGRHLLLGRRRQERKAQDDSPGHDLWKLMVEKSGLDVWDTMTTGDGAITFIEHVDPSQARMARFSIRMRYDAARMAERRSRAKQRL
jgi:hypothetical protein